MDFYFFVISISGHSNGQGMNSVHDVVRCFLGELQGDSLPCAPEGLHVLHIQGTIRLFIFYVIYIFRNR
jgi:hypothetical protein